VQKLFHRVLPVCEYCLCWYTLGLCSSRSLCFCIKDPSHAVLRSITRDNLGPYKTKVLAIPAVYFTASLVSPRLAPPSLLGTLG